MILIFELSPTAIGRRENVVFVQWQSASMRVMTSGFVVVFSTLIVA